MSNRERFFAGHVFMLGDMEIRYQFQLDNHTEYGRINQLALKTYWQYCGNIDNLTLDKFTVFYLYFNQLVSVNITFSELIFTNEKGESQS